MTRELAVAKLERNLRLIDELNAENQQLLEQLTIDRPQHTPASTADTRPPTTAARGLLSPKQVATQTGVDRKTIYRAIENGELRAVRIGNRLRIDPSDRDSWLEQAFVRTDGNTLAPAPAAASAQRRIRRLLDQHTQRSAA
jgi:excisionase family DNA binding protein